MTRLFGIIFGSLFAASPAFAQQTFNCPTDCEKRVEGDANGDGVVGIGDVIVFGGAYAGDYVPCDTADANHNGTIDIGDFYLVVQYLYYGGPAPAEHWCCDDCTNKVAGDANDDGTVTVADATRIFDYLQDSSLSICLASADVDADGYVEEEDGELLLEYLFAKGDAPVLECLP